MDPMPVIAFPLLAAKNAVGSNTTYTYYKFVIAL